MPQAILLITPELVRQLLSLPPETVLSTVDSSAVGGFYCAFFVEHPDIPDGAEYVKAFFHRQPEVVFDHWDKTSLS